MEIANDKYVGIIFEIEIVSELDIWICDDKLENH